MRIILTSFLVLLLMACKEEPEHRNVPEQTQADSYGELGTVNIFADCTDEANIQLKRGLAMVHHMTYVGARSAFVKAYELDSDCAMAYWGHAMSFIHPLWSDPPSEADFNKGKALLEKARANAQNKAQELAYIAAAEAYYSQGWNRNETNNLASFAQAWKEVYLQYPDDLEAASFYALAHMATANAADKTLTKQKEAGAIVEQVLSRNPHHPGAHHYIVHAYDYPPLADKALEVARSYGSIAPDIPHALHMPTHIFTRLGYWDESIDMNTRSAAAALQHPAGDLVSLHYLHALDYLAYAHLQKAEDAKAKEVLILVENIQDPVQPHAASAYTFAAVPARIALERQQWSEAAMLQPRQPESYPWDKFPAMEAITHFARALGAARSGLPEIANEALNRLAALYEQTSKTSAYWAKQIEIQRLSAQAWLLYEAGTKEKALEVMRNAADLEASTEKHPVTPGEVLPASELLADMLVETGKYAEALTMYKAALARSPNRLNSLYGAGYSAELAGINQQAAHYYEQLLQMARESESELPRLKHARAFLNES